MSNLARTWLNGPRPYIDGIALLESGGTTGASLINLLKSGETPFTRKKLVEAITLLAQSAEVDNLPVEPIERTKMITPYDPLELPPELKDVHLRKGQIFKEVMNLREKLFNLSNPKERKPICLRIVQLRKEHAKMWEQINFYLVHGKIIPPANPPEPEPDLEAMTVRELVDFIKNNPTRISKWNKMLKMETDLDSRKVLQDKIKRHKQLQIRANEIIDSL